MQQAAHLVTRKPLDIPQRDRLALRWRQRCHRSAHLVVQLAGEEALLGQVVGQGRHQPVSWPARIVGRSEAGRVDGWPSSRRQISAMLDALSLVRTNDGSMA